MPSRETLKESPSFRRKIKIKFRDKQSFFQGENFEGLGVFLP